MLLALERKGTTCSLEVHLTHYFRPMITISKIPNRLSCALYYACFDSMSLISTHASHSGGYDVRGIRIPDDLFKMVSQAMLSEEMTESMISISKWSHQFISAGP